MSDAPQYRPDEFANPSAPGNNPPPQYGQAPQFGQQPYGQPQHYGQSAPFPQQHGQPMHPSMPYGWARPEHPQSQLIFILGIVGIFTGVVSFVAWYMGGQAKKEIDAGAPYVWEGNLKTGYVLGKVFGIIAIVGGALAILFWIAYVLFFVAIFASMP